MRGVIVFVGGLLFISGLVLLSGVVLEPFLEVVVNNEAVQQMGLANDAERIVDTIQRNAPLIYIVYLLVFGVAWAFRRERVTSRRV